MKTRWNFPVLALYAAVAVHGEGADPEPEMLELDSTFVIEGKVEKPQVQFPLLREAPPLREIRFEQSFLEEILRLERENVGDPGK